MHTLLNCEPAEPGPGQGHAILKIPGKAGSGTSSLLLKLFRGFIFFLDLTHSTKHGYNFMVFHENRLSGY